MNDLQGLSLISDPSAKTESYYSRSRAPVIDDRVVAGLKKRMAESGGSTIRICLHEGPEAAFHEMIIVHKRGGSFPQHKHLTKDESYQMIEGVLRIEIFDEDAQPVESFRIGGPGTGLPFLVRIRSDVWHATIPETEHAVFHEARPGPFRGGDSVLREAPAA